MNTPQIIGTAFEYATISTSSVGIANDIQKLLEYLVMHEKTPAELKILTEAKELLIKYHFEHSCTAFKKTFNL